MKLKLIEHIPNTLNKIFHGMMLKWKFLQLITKADVKLRGAREKIWVLGSGIEA